MSIEVQCSRCGQRYAAPDSFTDKQVPCPSCGATVVVPPLPGAMPASPAAVLPGVPAVEDLGPLADPLDVLSEEETVAVPPPPPPSGMAAGRRVDAGRIGGAATLPSIPQADAVKPILSHVVKFLKRRWLVAVVLIAMLVAMSWHSDHGNATESTVSLALGLFIAAIGFLPRSERIETLLARILSYTAGGLTCLGAAGALYLVVMGKGPLASRLAFGAGYAVVVVISLAIISLVYHLLAWYGFHRVMGWWYVCLFVAVPIGLNALFSAPSTKETVQQITEWSKDVLPSGSGGDDAADSGWLSDVASVPVPAMPAAPTMRTLERGVRFAEVRLGVRPGQPGASDRLYLYQPEGTHAPRSLPCVLIAPAGSNLLTGMKLAAGDRPEHTPYVKQGFAVVGYELDGALADPEQATVAEFRRAFKAYEASRAGLVNARNALAYILARMPEVDPTRIYVAGHSSAGTMALLFSEYEPRIQGCVAYAPAADLVRHFAPHMDELRADLPECPEFIKRASPMTYADRISQPVFIFHATGDRVVACSESRDFVAKVKHNNGEATLETIPGGDHFQSMISLGIPAGIRWLKEQQRKQLLAGGNPSAILPPSAGPPNGDAIVWQATLDPAPPARIVPTCRFVPMGCSQSDIAHIAFSNSPEAARAVALIQSDPVRRSNGFPQYVASYDLVSGDSRTSVDLGDTYRFLAAGPYGTRFLLGNNNEFSVAEFPDGNLVARWSEIDSSADRIRWATFISTDLVALLDHSERLQVRQLPDAGLVYQIDNVGGAAVSAGGHYLIVLEHHNGNLAGYIYDATTGEARGRLARPANASLPSGTALHCAVSRDGRRFAALGHSTLLAWDLSDGHLLVDGANVPANDSVQFLGDDLLLCDQSLFDLGREAVVWQYNGADLRHARDQVDGSPDDRAWLVLSRGGGQAFLSPVVLPDDLTRQDAGVSINTITHNPTSTPTLQPLIDELPEFDGSTRPGLMPSALQRTPSRDIRLVRSSFEYVRNHFLSLMLRPADLVDCLRWFAEVKRPVVGLRWGVGVTWTSKVAMPQLTSEYDLARITGTIGPGIADGLNQRIAGGQFGDWPQQGDPRLRRLVLVGCGKSSDLFDNADFYQLDALAILDLSPKAIGMTGRVDNTIRVRLIDVDSRKTLWTSNSLSSRRVAAAQRKGEDLSGDLVRETLEQVDALFDLKPMPALQAEHVKRRVASLLDSYQSNDDPWPILIELRYYQAKGLLPEKDAAAAYDRLLGKGKGQTLASGNETQCREILSPLVTP